MKFAVYQPKLQMGNFCHFRAQIQLEQIYRLVTNPNNKTFSRSNDKKFSHLQMDNIAISTFAILEEMASEQQSSSKQKHF